MDSIHDSGGAQGFGRIDVEADEPVFHEPWQRKSFDMMMAIQITMRGHKTDEHQPQHQAPIVSHLLLVSTKGQ